jgi:hypothetical protein
MESFLLIISPFFVNVITNAIKKLRRIQLSNNKKIVIRFIAALFSFVSIVLGNWVIDTPVDNTTIVTFAETVFVFLGSQITYFYFKGK